MALEFLGTELGIIMLISGDARRYFFWPERVFDSQSLNHSSLVRDLLEFQQGRPQLLGNLERSDPEHILLGGSDKPLPRPSPSGSRTKDAGLLTARKTILSWRLSAIYWGL